jgi:hypothetical protein
MFAFMLWSWTWPVTTEQAMLARYRAETQRILRQAQQDLEAARKAARPPR